MARRTGCVVGAVVLVLLVVLAGIVVVVLPRSAARSVADALGTAVAKSWAPGGRLGSRAETLAVCAMGLETWEQVADGEVDFQELGVALPWPVAQAGIRRARMSEQVRQEIAESFARGLAELSGEHHGHDPAAWARWLERETERAGRLEVYVERWLLWYGAQAFNSAPGTLSLPSGMITVPGDTLLPWTSFEACRVPGWERASADTAASWLSVERSTGRLELRSRQE